MAIRRQHIASQLHVLQEAVASAVHELSQPLNVVNLLADNALEDVTVLQAAGIGDAEVLGGLRRRVESIVEQSGKASDITRWIRAFAIGIGEDAAEFDPDAVIERIAGIFSNDLRVAGVTLVAEPAPGQRSAVGNEALLGFALTETILWMSSALPRPAMADPLEEAPGREIRILCTEDAQSQSVVVAIGSDTVSGSSPDRVNRATSQAPDRACDDKIPAALPLLALVGQAPGSQVTVSRTDQGGVRIRLSLPLGQWRPEP